MAHHSSKPDFDSDKLKKMFNEEPSPKNAIDKIFEKAAQDLELGKMNNFPEGRISGSDEGELRLAVTDHDGKVILNFGKPVAWVGFTAEQAREIGTMLIRRSDAVLSQQKK